MEFRDLGWKGSFKRFMGLKLDLERLLGRTIDLVEPKAIVNPYFALVANRHRADLCRLKSSNFCATCTTPPAT